MNISKILLLCIICIFAILILNKFTNYLNLEYINNDLPNNNIVSMDNSNLLIPTSDQLYNPNDSNRPGNNYSHQDVSITNININTDVVNTDIDIPLVYSRDEISDTTIIQSNSPSYIATIIDAGSGSDINPNIEINNTILNNFVSIE
jgi:hypothetical protein